MEGEGESGPRLSKRFKDKGGEVDFNLKAGTAWSHNFLNQKPWHPLSYPNQRRKWIAEQTHVHRERRAEEVAREFAQEQEFFRQTALVSEKEKEKMEIMKAVSFMYVRPPGYNAESAKAAEMAEERRKDEQGNQQQDVPSSSMPPPSERDQSRDDKKKSVPKDVFGRALPTEEQFEVLKNAPRLETGAPARPKPFAVEIRNVKCLRCGKFGHQSGDRECPLKDAIMPNEESRLQRDDPLTTMMAHAESNEPLKWELKQKPGMSPPRGGFDPDDPNQQIVAEDIFDEYGGFLGAETIPDLLATFTSSKPKKKSKSKKKHKRRSSPSSNKYKNDEERGSSGDDGDDRKMSKKRKPESKKSKHPESSSPDYIEKVARKDTYDDEMTKSESRSKKGNHNKAKHRYVEPSSNKYRYDGDHGSSSDDDDRTGSKKRKHESRKSKHLESSLSDRDEKVEKTKTYNDEMTESRSRSKKRNDFKKYGDFEPSSSDHEERDREKKAYNYNNDERVESRTKKRDCERIYQKYPEPNYSSGDGGFDNRHRRSRHRRSYYSSDDLRRELPSGKKSSYREDDGSFSNDDDNRGSENYGFRDEKRIKRNKVYEDDRDKTKSRLKNRDDNEAKHRPFRKDYSPRHSHYDMHSKSSRRGHSYSSDDSAFDECHKSKHSQSSRVR